MFKINDTPKRTLKPVFDFTWSPVGPALNYNVGGSNYPYIAQQDGVSRNSDGRYQSYSTPINTLVTFTAQIKYIGGTVIHYRWDFGNGETDLGPTVGHTFKVANPQNLVTLTITSNKNQTAYRTKILNLR
jgi:hypothetical protein